MKLYLEFQYQNTSSIQLFFILQIHTLLFLKLSKHTGKDY